MCCPSRPAAPLRLCNIPKNPPLELLLERSERQRHSLVKSLALVTVHFEKSQKPCQECREAVLNAKCPSRSAGPQQAGACAQTSGPPRPPAGPLPALPSATHTRWSGPPRSAARSRTLHITTGRRGADLSSQDMQNPQHCVAKIRISGHSGVRDPPRGPKVHK